MPKLYLDTSGIVKRYALESGTEVIDEVFDRAEGGEVRIAFSLWNLGEVMGVFDERLSRGWISKEDFNSVLGKFVGEIVRLSRLKAVEIIPVVTSVLTDGWSLILDSHLYEADSLQISTCVASGCEALLTGDRPLVKAARKAGLRAYDVATDGEEIRHLLRS